MDLASRQDLTRAWTILTRMLDTDFAGASAFREQLSAATLQRHETGCQIIVDRGQVAPAAFDPRFSSARLPVEGLGHGGLRLLLHSHEGYLDNLELLNAAEFPLPESVRVGSDD